MPVSGNRPIVLARYLALAWRLFRWAIIVALVFFALLIVERVFVTVA